MLNERTPANHTPANTLCTDSQESAFNSSQPALVYSDGRIHNVSSLLGHDVNAHNVRLHSIDQKLAYKLRLRGMLQHK